MFTTFHFLTVNNKNYFDFRSKIPKTQVTAIFYWVEFRKSGFEVHANPLIRFCMQTFRLLRATDSAVDRIQTEKLPLINITDYYC